MRKKKPESHLLSLQLLLFLLTQLGFPLLLLLLLLLLYSNH